MTASPPLPPQAYGDAPTSLSYAPADTTLVGTNAAGSAPGYDLGYNAGCQLGNGSNMPVGTTNNGFSDTTYSLTRAQILAMTTSGF
jgi:hypothetical protein